MPVALSACGLLLYNKLRFDAWFDFGMEKQLTIWPFRFSWRYLLPNALSYLLRLPEVRCDFPFVFASIRSGSSPLARFIPDPSGYVLPEQVVGMLIAVPAVWTLPFAFAPAFDTVVRWFRAQRLPELPARRVRIWWVACFAALAALPALGPWGIRLATMRYLGDVTNACVLLGVFGLWTLHSWFGDRRALRRAVSAVGIALAVMTAAVGVLLGYQGYSETFIKTRNPDLHEALSRSLSLCSPPALVR